MSKVLRIWYVENGHRWTIQRVTDPEEAKKVLSALYSRALKDRSVVFNAGGMEEMISEEEAIELVGESNLSELDRDNNGQYWIEWYDDEGRDIQYYMDESEE